MTDTVTTNVIFSGTRRYIIQLQNLSDGTGESAVAKIDKSGLIGPNGSEPGSLVIEECEYAIQGFTSIQFLWDHTTDDEALTLPAGTGFKDFTAGGGLHDPGSAGGTGDLVLTTNDAAANATYDITLVVRLKD